MIINENIYGLFPFTDFTYPEGEYNFTITNKKYKLFCTRVVVLQKIHFLIRNDLTEFYEKIDKNSRLIVSKLPFVEEMGILLTYNYFNTIKKRFCKGDKELEKYISSTCTLHFCLRVTYEHIIDDHMPISDCISEINEKKEHDKLESAYFIIIRKFHEYLMVLRSPYIKIIDVNYLYMKGLFSFLCTNEKVKLTNTVVHCFDYFEPTAQKLQKQVMNHFNNNTEMPIEDLLISKSKIWFECQKAQIKPR